jgi:hypothetical protein
MKLTSISFTKKSTISLDAKTLMTEIDRALARVDKNIAVERRKMQILKSKSEVSDSANLSLHELLGNKQVLLSVKLAIEKNDFKDLKSI